MSQESPTRSSHVNACPGIDWGARSLSSYSPKPELRLCGPRLTRALRCPPLRPQHGASVYPAYVIHYTRHTCSDWSDEVAGQVGEPGVAGRAGHPGRRPVLPRLCRRRSGINRASIHGGAGYRVVWGYRLRVYAMAVGGLSGCDYGLREGYDRLACWFAVSEDTQRWHPGLLTWSLYVSTWVRTSAVELVHTTRPDPGDPVVDPVPRLKSTGPCSISVSSMARS